MKRILAVFFVVALAFTMFSGCATTQTGEVSGPSCEDIVAYIATIDAIAASWPPGVYTDEVKAAKAWYTLARTGAIAGLSKKCPDMVKNLPPVPPTAQ